MWQVSLHLKLIVVLSLTLHAVGYPRLGQGHEDLGRVRGLGGYREEHADLTQGCRGAPEPGHPGPPLAAAGHCHQGQLHHERGHHPGRLGKLEIVQARQLLLGALRKELLP